MDYRRKYKTKEEIHNKALKIIGKTRGELIKELNYHTKGKKNAMGDLFERWFGKTKDNESEPDLGIVELKATPFKQLKNGTYSPKERLVLNMIDYCKIVKEDFENSHMFHKSKTMEIAFYLALINGNEKIPLDDLKFKYVILYQMSKHPEDFEQIKHDFYTIKKRVEDGHAQDLNEGLTEYLAACTKASNSKVRTTQPKSKIPVKPRAFSLKSGYMKVLLNEAMGNEHSESIIKNDSELKKESLSDIIKKHFNSYIGQNQKELLNKFHIESKAKNKNNMLIKAMLGLDSKNGNIDDIKEFKKASIIPKTIQFDNKGTNRESMSLPPFNFKKLVSQNWEDEYGNPEADINNYFSENKFLFVVFQYDSDKRKSSNNIFKGAKFYNFPNSIIENQIKKVWKDTKDKLINGVHLRLSGKRVINNFIGKKDEMIVHIRPHAAKRAYVPSKYSNRLPHAAKWTNKPYDYSDYYMTTQSFWINNNYIKKIVSKLLD